MAEVLSVISWISFIGAGICFTLAVFFWFQFGIPTVIGDLSGRTARKSIAKMQEINESGRSDAHQTYLLEEQETEGFLTEDEATVPLGLTLRAPAGLAGGKKLVMLDEVILVHTDEVIG